MPVINLDERRPHFVINTADGNSHVYPVAALMDFAQGKDVEIDLPVMRLQACGGFCGQRKCQASHQIKKIKIVLAIEPRCTIVITWGAESDSPTRRSRDQGERS